MTRNPIAKGAVVVGIMAATMFAVSLATGHYAYAAINGGLLAANIALYLFNTRRKD